MHAVHIGSLGTELQRGESSVAGTKKESPEGLSLKWRLPTLPQRSAVPSAMLGVRAALPPLSHALAPSARVSAHTARPTPSATADTARASEAGLAMSNAG